MEEKENEYYGIYYKINTTSSYKIYKQESNGKVFYKIQVKKKNYDNTTTSFYKQIKFAKCTPPENGEIVKIIHGFEDLYTNQKDPYNPISVIVVTEYIRLENEKVNQEQAYQEYQNKLKENEEELDEANLPF